MSATFAPLTLVQPTSPCLELMANEERAGMLSSFCEYEFEVEWGRFATEADILVDESTEIAVLPQCFMPEGGDCTLSLQPRSRRAHERAARPSTR